MNLEIAILIAHNAHKGQIDKGGAHYIFHPLRVMGAFKEEEKQICAVLHDVIEDTHITLEDLKAEGFSEIILNALDSLTRRKDECYNDFIKRIIKNNLASCIKLADLSDNMDLARIPNPSEIDYKRVEKYRKAFDKISQELNLRGINN